MEINGAYGGRPTWVTLQGAQVPKIGLCIEVDRIHRRRGGGRVAVGQGSDRKHIRVGGDRACMLWLLHGKNWEFSRILTGGEVGGSDQRRRVVGAASSHVFISPITLFLPVVVSPRRPPPLTHHILYTTFLSTLSPQRATHPTGNSARFLTQHLPLDSTSPHNHSVIHSIRYTYISFNPSPRTNHGQMCVCFSTLTQLRLEMNVTCGLTPFNSFALTPFATTLGLHPHPCPLR